MNIKNWLKIKIQADFETPETSLDSVSFNIFVFSLLYISIVVIALTRFIFVNLDFSNVLQLKEIFIKEKMYNIFILLFFGIPCGLVISFLRKFIFKTFDIRIKNLISGIFIGLSYASICFLSDDFSFANDYSLFIFVFLGITWAITSALNELLEKL